LVIGTGTEYIFFGTIDTPTTPGGQSINFTISVQAAGAPLPPNPGGGGGGGHGVVHRPAPPINPHPIHFPTPPPHQVPRPLFGVGSVGLGDVNSDAENLVTAFNVDNGVTVCTSMPIVNGVRQPNPDVLAFQVSYNASTSGQKLDEDGLYGPNCAVALANTLQAAGSSSQAPGDCSNFNAPSPGQHTATNLSDIAAEVAGDQTLCNGINSNVQAFQDAYNQKTGSTLGVQQDYGFYTADTAQAMLDQGNVALPSYLLPPPAACTNFPNPAGPGSNPTGGTVTPPIVQPPFIPPTNPTQPSTNTTTTNYTPWILGALAVLAGAGGLYYLNRHKHTASSSPTLGPSSHPASTPLASRMLARGGHHVRRAGHALAHHARTLGHRARAAVHHATR
jgi:hypothetical protein